MKCWIVGLLLMALIVPAGAQSAATDLLDELTKKAQAGDVEAQLQLGEAYEYGRDVPQDDELAVQRIFLVLPGPDPRN